MEIRICKPIEIEEDVLDQIIDLIVQGGQIKSNRSGIMLLLSLADYVAYKIYYNVVICTATLKNQFPEYKEKVFNLANGPSPNRYQKELGFIVTHPDFENQGHCQSLLGEFFKRICSNSIYATTRKASMKHILCKFGFRQTGTVYNDDLTLLICDNIIGSELHNLLSNIAQNSGSMQEVRF